MDELAREREKIEVVTRLVRHNLRHESQPLLFAADRLEDAVTADVAADVESLAEELSAMHETLART